MANALQVRPVIDALPSYTTPESLLADSLPILDPPEQISVTDAAERYMMVEVAGSWQRYDRRVAPYMIEPQDMARSRRYTAVAVVAPSQCGKTKAIEVIANYAVTCDPMPVQIIHMSQTDRDAWVEEKLNATIEHSPELRARLGRGKDDSTFSRKRFRGMRMALGYPTSRQLSARTQGMVLLTDLDHMPVLLGPADNPEGTPFKMARNRVRTYMSRGCVWAESTPAFPVSDSDWRPNLTVPHMLPPVSAGIVAHYNEGTRGRWYWECPHCRDEFEPRFDRLRYDDALDPHAAGERAEMECPHCGALIDHKQKIALNRAAIEGRGGWRHEGEDGSAVPIDSALVRRSSIASYALNGAAAAFMTWAEMVEDYEISKARAENTGDDADLATFYYTKVGVPFMRQDRGAKGDFSARDLMDAAKPHARGVAPSWTRFITVSADVQATRFPVQVTAWGVAGERMVIDRFDLHKPPEGAPDAESRTVQPARFIEDWSLLADLTDKVWPVDGEDYGLMPIALGVDFQGEVGVSDNAEKFWRARKEDGTHRLWFLTRGQGGFKIGWRTRFAAPDAASGRKKARRIKLLTMATDRLKDSVMASLGRMADGRGALHLPEWMTEEIVQEFLAEERTDQGWRKRRGMRRNESMDLSVQALAMAEYKGLASINWDDPPLWAIGGPGNSRAAPLEGKQKTAAQPAQEARPTAPKRIGYLSR